MHSSNSMDIGKKYDKIATWWNSNVAFSKRGLKEVELILNLAKGGKSALDVGCGSGGRVIQMLTDAGFQVTGIDVSRKMVDLARLQHPLCTFLTEDIRSLETKEVFDLIIAWDSIWHIPSNEHKGVLKKLCGLLSPGGVLAYTFGDDEGDKKDLSFKDNSGRQMGDLDNDYFNYGSIGVYENISEMRTNGMKISYFAHLNDGPAFLIAKKSASIDD